MATLRVLFLWHMHQPFYKDLVSGEYRLPWVRMHALKDYYGMVKLLDEFPDVHQTFNLVPSLLAQIQDYVAGTARDPFLSISSRPARDFSSDDRRFALQYLFQANPTKLIGRYPRYQQLWDKFRANSFNPARAETAFDLQEYTDLQVLSQLAWFDEFFLDDPEVRRLIQRGRGFSEDDQRFVVAREREIMAAIIPAYAAAWQRGGIEVSTSPFYHPILPLVCDTNQGAVSSPGLPLPHVRFRRPDDASEQLKRGLDLHERLFGRRPVGVWPSEGSVSEEVFAIGHHLGVRWMATDEGVLGRSIGFNFSRDGSGRLAAGGPERLYAPYLYEKDGAEMRLVFRDHSLSDLIGFVYSGMPATDAATHLIHSIKEAAQPVLQQGKDALVSIILDGENAWEFYPESGREFLRRVYAGLQNSPELEAVTVSEAAERHRDPPRLNSLVPGSWINANFNVWIGAPEDNRAWDDLSDARSFYEQGSHLVSQERKQVAFEELLIAEGSDWNWWYGPEHHSANDRDFDELYRKHLSNVYTTLGAAPPLYLAQPIISGVARPSYTPQTAYIKPRLRADMSRYFDWLGAASYIAESHTGSMHGKVSLLDAIFAGIDESNLYCRVDFVGGIPLDPLEVSVICETAKKDSASALRLQILLENRQLRRWTLSPAGSAEPIADSGYNAADIRLTVFKNLEFQIPLSVLGADLGSTIRLRATLLRESLPLDALPLEGWIELPVQTKEELEGSVYNYSPSS